MADLEEDARKGREARLELEHPLIAEAFAVLEERLMNAWRTSKEADQALRDACYRQLRALEAVKSYLRATVDSGKIAQAELDALTPKQE